MEPNDGDYVANVDTRNVKAQAGARGKRMGMVKKSYNHKAITKIMYAKEEREKRRYDAYKVAEDEKQRIKEEKEWADPVSDKHSKKKQEKAMKAEEKVRKKLEKLQLTKAEMKNGHK
eukprot:TRINITY_DN7460_c0_g1_i5.p1 TRINITY_DN7460_c0_g1~~TRINITY_DN7460_c0_g1_i5.p1  ORF type:complete len:117 (-),score=57.66 TRINITY_DN7460_c0_g1_i5:194-544(-)